MSRDADRPVPAAPATRRLARELGVVLHEVPASGPGGRVTPEDVRAFAAARALGVVPIAAPPAPAPVAAAAAPVAKVAPEPGVAVGTGIPLLDVEPLPDFAEFGPVEKEALRSIRRKIARKMVTSMILVPHVAHMDDADVTALEELRRSERKRREGQPGGKLTLLPFVMKAIVSTLRAFPAFNASLDAVRQEIIYKKYYNIGFAADTPKGLVVPVVHAVDRRSILEVSKEVVALADAARKDTLDVASLRGGTFTVTNIGSLGGRYFVPTINYPEVAILGMGKVEERPVVVDGRIAIRTILPLSLCFDHRVTDGAVAARFMNELIRKLADPQTLLLEG